MAKLQELATEQRSNVVWFVLSTAVSAVISYYTTHSARISGLPAYKAILLGAGVFLTLAIGLYLLSLAITTFAKRKAVSSSADQGGVDEHAKASRERERIEELEREKTQYSPLLNIAERDKREIDKYVVVTDPSINYGGRVAEYPYFVITFKVFNYSVYPISISPNDVKGSIYRNHEEISGNLKMDSEVENLTRGHGYMILALKQWADAKEIELLVNPLVDTVLKFDRLKITVRGADESLGVESKRLILPPIPIKETQPPNLRVEDLKGRIRELEGEKAALQEQVNQQYIQITTLEDEKSALEAGVARAGEQHRIEVGRLQELAETHSVRASMNQGLLDQYKWLHEMAEKQSREIGSWVVVEQVRFCYREFIAPIPYLIFAVDVHNKSVFDITIEDEIKGHIKIAGERLLGEKELINNPKISPSDKGSLTIKQRLSPTEIGLVSACEKEQLGAFYYFDNLEMMIAARTENPRFEHTPLQLPEHISSKDSEIVQLKNELTSLRQRSELIITLSLALGGAYTLANLFKVGEPPSKERIEDWFNSTLRGHVHRDYVEAICEGLPELTDSPDEQRALMDMYCSRLRRLIRETRQMA